MGLTDHIKIKPKKMISLVKEVYKKLGKPYYARYNYNDDIGFCIDENNCPLCPKCLLEAKSTPGQYLGNRKMSCIIHGEVQGAKSIKDGSIVKIDASKESADEIFIKRVWHNPKNNNGSISPISAESIDTIKASSKKRESGDTPKKRRNNDS